MHSQLFSNKTRGFYPIKSLRYYKSVGALPDDLVRISDTEHANFIGSAPSNCVPNYNIKNKKMEWLEVSPPQESPEETQSANRRELLKRQREAAIHAFPLQSAIELGVADSVVIAQLDELKRYVVALTAVDLSTPEWPTAPEWVAE